MEDWDKIMNVNLKGVVLSYKYAALQMIRQGRGGRIIGELGSRDAVCLVELMYP